MAVDRALLQIIRRSGHSCGMQHGVALYEILRQLKETVLRHPRGAVVELGCFDGGTAMCMQMVLDHLGARNRLHVYDTFEGLPAPSDEDRSRTARRFNEGDCRAPRQALVRNFERFGLRMPRVHAGRFGDLPDEDYPEPIVFAHFDSDLYVSTFDSFMKVYPKLAVGGVVLVGDYDWDTLPGVKRACDEFLGQELQRLPWNRGVLAVHSCSRCAGFRRDHLLHLGRYVKEP